jgi:hypothetical protein
VERGLLEHVESIDWGFELKQERGADYRADFCSAVQRRGSVDRLLFRGDALGKQGFKFD